MQALMELAFREDLGQGCVPPGAEGDHTTAACIPKNAVESAGFLMKEGGVIAGLDVARQVYAHGAPGVKFEAIATDGARVEKGDVVARVSGPARGLLSCERLALNFMQRMSGIATATATAVKALDGTKTQVLDTRKTTPGIRDFEKLAVRLGGGVNHRMGLYDAVMIKDNHVDYAGSVSKAVQRASAYLSNKGLTSLDVIVEVRDLKEVREALQTHGITRLLLDNFTPEQTREAVAEIAGRLETEGSGGLTPSNIRPYAEAGLDFVSLGFITHSARNLDISLLSAAAIKLAHK
jgi:nicotinate-nucleotide pyrophosphorylase (carboxylating)